MKKAYREGSIWSVLLFTWINPIFSIQDDDLITPENLSTFPPSYYSEKQHHKILSTWEKYYGRNSRLLKAVFRSYLSVFIENTIMVLIKSVGEMASPFLLLHIINFLEHSSSQEFSERIWPGIVLMSAIALVKLMTALLSQMIEIRQQIASDQAICGISAMVYCKALRLSSASEKIYSQGKIMNLIQLDCRRVAGLIRNISTGVNMIAKVIFSLVLLYHFLGIVALAGVGICIISIFLNYFLSKIRIKLDKKMMEAQDERMKKTTEVIQNIKIIKMYGWSDRFKSQIFESRNQEVITMQKAIFYSGLFIIALYIYPKLVSIGTFFLYAAVNDKITLGEVFASINVFTILANPLRIFPYMLRSFVDSFLSSKRIQEFLECDEVPTVYKDTNSSSRYAIELRNCSFSWKEAEKKRSENQKEENKEELKLPLMEENKEAEALPKKMLALEGISISIPEGQFVFVIGEIGSGKSSLLQAVLGEMHPEFQEKELYYYLIVISQFRFSLDFFNTMDNNI